jgi:hypothetical protein
MSWDKRDEFLERPSLPFLGIVLGLIVVVVNVASAMMTLSAL